MIDQLINTCSSYSFSSLHMFMICKSEKSTLYLSFFSFSVQIKIIFSSCSLHNVYCKYRSDWHFEGGSYSINNNRSIDSTVLVQMLNGWWSSYRHTLDFFFSLIILIVPINRLAFIKQVNSIKDISHLEFFVLFLLSRFVVNVTHWLLLFVRSTVEWMSIRCYFISHLFFALNNLTNKQIKDWRKCWNWMRNKKTDVLILRSKILMLFYHLEE